MKIEVTRGFYSTLTPACSAGVLFRRVNVRRSRSFIQLAMVDSELESVDGEGGGREMRGNFYYPTSSPLLSFNRRLPPWYEFFSPQRSTAVKIKDVSSNFHQENT